MTEKIRTWKSGDFLCVHVDDGVSKATVSLAADEIANILQNLSGGKAVAWRVKDYGGGWLLFSNEHEAAKTAWVRQAEIEPLYAVRFSTDQSLK